MLELLAGPFNLREPNGTAVTVSSGSGNALYDDTVGMMSTSSVFSGTVVQQCVTQIDGVSYARASTPNATAFVLDLTTPADWLAIDTLLADKLYAFDRLTAVRGALILSGSTGAFNGCQARCADRFLYIVDGNVQFRPPDLSAGATTEATLTGHGSGTPSVSRTNQATVLCLAYPSGEIIFYDFVAKTQPPGSAYIGANHGAWYSTKHNVYLALTGSSPQQVSVYANNAAPTAISAPTASPALQKGRVSTISVILTGANGEPCDGELVNWTLSGPGTLLATQSETDATGTASVQYAATLTLSTNPTFTASVTL